jgi:hypothetical protein
MGLLPNNSWARQDHRQAKDGHRKRLWSSKTYINARRTSTVNHHWPKDQSDEIIEQNKTQYGGKSQRLCSHASHLTMRRGRELMTRQLTDSTNVEPFLRSEGTQGGRYRGSPEARTQRSLRCARPRRADGYLWERCMCPNLIKCVPANRNPRFTSMSKPITSLITHQVLTLTST